MDKYEIVETIGTGSFGVVNKAIEKETKNIVALKGINKVQLNNSMSQNRRIIEGNLFPGSRFL